MLIKISNLEIYGFHGVKHEENVLGGKFKVSIEISTKYTPYDDNIKHTVHYGHVIADVVALVKNEKYFLIETLALNITRLILTKYDLVDKITVEVSKPEAPIPYHFNNISVCMTDTWHHVYLSLGSNIGDRKFYLNSAYQELSNHTLFKSVIMSSIIETKPYGNVDQDDFLNAVISCYTLMTPYELLDYIHIIEAKYGRTRDVHWGPRTLDIDIIYYDDLKIDTKTLTIPHKDAHNRDFVMNPIKELQERVLYI